MVKPQTQKQEVTFLTPRTEAVKIKGKLFYSESDQSWNMIRLKKEIMHEFPLLKEKSLNFGYMMVVAKSKDDVEKVLSESEENGTIPILLFFNKEG